MALLQRYGLHAADLQHEALWELSDGVLLKFPGSGILLICAPNNAQRFFI